MSPDQRQSECEARRDTIAKLAAVQDPSLAEYCTKVQSDIQGMVDILGQMNGPRSCMDRAFQYSSTSTADGKNLLFYGIFRGNSSDALQSGINASSFMTWCKESRAQGPMGAAVVENVRHMYGNQALSCVGEMNHNRLLTAAANPNDADSTASRRSQIDGYPILNGTDYRKPGMGSDVSVIHATDLMGHNADYPFTNLDMPPADFTQTDSVCKTNFAEKIASLSVNSLTNVQGSDQNEFAGRCFNTFFKKDFALHSVDSTKAQWVLDARALEVLCIKELKAKGTDYLDKVLLHVSYVAQACRGDTAMQPVRLPIGYDNSDRANAVDDFVQANYFKLSPIKAPEWGLGHRLPATPAALPRTLTEIQNEIQNNAALRYVPGSKCPSACGEGLEACIARQNSHTHEVEFFNMGQVGPQFFTQSAPENCGHVSCSDFNSSSLAPMPGATPTDQAPYSCQ